MSTSNLDSKQFKGVAVDGRNFSQMLQGIGVRETNFRGLNHVFRQKIGDPHKFVQRPRYAVPEDLCKRGKRLHDDLMRAGILPRAVSSFGEADDAAVIRWGSRYIQDPKVVDVVVVTCDTEILQYLLSEGARRYLGGDKDFRLHVLGSLAIEGGGRCAMRTSLLRAFGKLTFVNFYDVRQFRGVIAK